MRDIGVKDLYKYQWEQVQHLTYSFWGKWKREYLDSLQKRTKWREIHQNIKENDIVLVRDNAAYRNDWPLGIVVNAIASPDSCGICKAEIRIVHDVATKTYTRSVTELILLTSEE